MSIMKVCSTRYRRASSSMAEFVDGAQPESCCVEPTTNLILTSVSLVSGTAVGAGILAIASVSLKPGFIPSTITLMSAWGLMTGTGFLIAEITCNIALVDRSAKNFGIIAITDRILGKFASQSIGFCYVCFHYTLLIAYIAEAGGILSRVTHIPSALGPILFTTVMGSIIAFSSSRAIDLLNSAFFVIVVVTFLGLVCIGIGSVRLGNLGYQNYSEVGLTVPILLVALVFHNIIPTVCSNLFFHRRSIYIALVVGSSIPLVMFILWNAVILGMVQDYSAAAHSSSLIDPVEVLLGGNNPTHGSVFGKVLVTIFSEAAITTSFIGFVIGLMEFYGDIFPRKSKKDFCLYALVLVPPALVALGNPDIFLQALDAAGAYGISVLFGLLPGVLALRLRADAAKETRTILVSSADTEAAVHSALSTDSAHSVDSSYSIRNNDNAITREEGREGEGQDGSSHSCEGVELSVLEAKSLITNHTPSYEGSSISSPIHPAAGDKDISSSSGDIEGAHNPHSLHSQHSLHSPVGHSFHTTGCGATTMTGSNADYAFAYVSFVPGGDAGIYFMMALFVAIVIDKLVTTAIGAT